MSSQAITESIALRNAPNWQVEPITQNARSAVNLCDLCATAIAQSLVAIKHGSDPALHLGRVSMAERTRQTLTRSLVLFAESLENIDTIPTIASLRLWFGYAQDAMRKSIQTEGTGSECAQNRFLYKPKASRRERESGLLGYIPCVKCGELDSVTHFVFRDGKPVMRDGKLAEEKCHRNGHPTVKPLELMRWLCRLTSTPTGGIVLDPFMGSGRTGMAAILEGRDFIGIEQERASFDVAEAAIRWATEQVPEMVQPSLIELQESVYD